MKKFTNEQIDSIYKDGCFVKMEKNITLKIIRDCGLQCAMLYNVILMHKNNSNAHGCYPSYDTLMQECCISSKSTFLSYLDKLVEHGYLKIKSGNKSYSSAYYFPLSHSSITNYNDEDYSYIDNVKRKKGTKVQNVSDQSLNNLKNYSVEQNINNDPFAENPFTN